MSLQDVFYDRKEIASQDDRRLIHEFFNNADNDLPCSFISQQTKGLEISQDRVILGEHFHDYKETYYQLTGASVFFLEDPETKEKKEYILHRQDRILIPENIAHMVTAKKDSVIIGNTAQPYIDGESNDIRYPMEWARERIAEYDFSILNNPL